MGIIKKSVRPSADKKIKREFFFLLDFLVDLTEFLVFFFTISVQSEFKSLVNIIITYLNADSIKLTRDKTILNKIAHQKLSTLNPGTSKLTNKTNKPLITKVKRPRVKILIGNEIKIRIGLMTAFTNPKTTATTMATKKLDTLTPGKIYAEIRTAKALKSKFIISRIN